MDYVIVSTRAFSGRQGGSSHALNVEKRDWAKPKTKSQGLLALFSPTNRVKKDASPGNFLHDRQLVQLSIGERTETESFGGLSARGNAILSFTYWNCSSLRDKEIDLALERIPTVASASDWSVQVPFEKGAILAQ